MISLPGLYKLVLSERREMSQPHPIAIVIDIMTGRFSGTASPLNRFSDLRGDSAYPIGIAS
jgi:hypothetical protein